MIRSEQTNKTNERELCWTRDACSFLRLELANGLWRMLPYAHLQTASVHSETNREVLVVDFTSHRVRLVGMGLRKIMMAMQKCAVESLRVMSASQRMRAGEGSSWITSIDIEEIQNFQAHPHHENGS